MKQCIKITGFIIAISVLVIFSNEIQNEIIESYNQVVDQLASNIVANTNPIGF